MAPTGKLEGSMQYKHPCHDCECYGHTTELPDYEHEISHPRTLQGYYAKNSGCPCPPGSGCPGSDHPPCCPGRGQQRQPLPVEKPYLEREGPHTVWPQSGPDLPRDPVTHVRTTFPNRKNYGGVVADRGPVTLTTAAQTVNRKKDRAEKKEQRMRDRQNFLKAVLRDETLARLDAEESRDMLESELGLLGVHHVEDFCAQNGAHSLTGTDPRRGLERQPHEIPTVADQYADVIEELQFTAQQPVGSKYNIVRLHYLCEEQDRISAMRFRDRVAQRQLSMSGERK